MGNPDDDPFEKPIEKCIRTMSRVRASVTKFSLVRVPSRLSWCIRLFLSILYHLSRSLVLVVGTVLGLGLVSSLSARHS